MPWWAWSLRFAGLGWYIALCILAGIVGGYFLDRWLGTKPLFILVGILLGTVVAFYGVYRMVAPLMSMEKNGGSPRNSNTGSRS
ncbi:MAG: AtpZ/AtpI family protein [Chloroflexi bacterium]|nr:AtpZ/AtpI family protein [Chloroflexota bacterium]